jgi:hypothetical protein
MVERGPEEEFERNGGGGGVRFSKDGSGGVHIHGHNMDTGEEEDVFSLGREDTAKLARWLLRVAGVKA